MCFGTLRWGRLVTRAARCASITSARTRLHAVLCVGFICSAGRQANAEPPSTNKEGARTLAYEGVAALQAGDVETARSNLNRAYAVLRVPSIALWSARALVASGDLLGARERLREATLTPVFDGDPEIQRAALRDAQSDLANLEPRIPSLTLEPAGEATGYSVQLDGKPLPSSDFTGHSVNPGSHRLEVRTRQAHYQLQLELAEGEHQFTDLPLRTPAQIPAATAEHALPRQSCVGAHCHESDPRRTLGFIALGTGVAAFVGAGIAAGIASNKLDRIHADPRCERDTCSRDAEDLVDAYSTARTVSNVGWIAGGVLTLTGASLLLFSIETPDQPLAVSAGPLRVDLRARF